MNLELNAEENKYLKHALSRYLEDLAHEIVRTDDARFRRGLIQEEELLTVLERRLQDTPEPDGAYELA